MGIGIVLGFCIPVYLFPFIGAAVGNAHLARHLEQVGPMTAGLAIQATTGLRGLRIGPWAGLGVLGALPQSHHDAGLLLGTCRRRSPVPWVKPRSVSQRVIRAASGCVSGTTL